MGEITKSLWRNITSSVNTVVPAAADRLPLAVQAAGVPMVTETTYTTVAQLAAVIGGGGAFVDLVATGHAAIGPDAAIDGFNPLFFADAFQILTVQEEITTQTNVNGLMVGISSILDFNPGIDYSIYLTAGVVGAVVSDAASPAGNNLGFVYGVFGSVYLEGSLDGNQAYGVYAESTWASVGTLTSLFGVAATISHTGAGVVTDSFGLRAARPSGAGSITNVYGLFLENHAARGVTISRNIHSAGAAAENFFEGIIVAGVRCEPDTNDGAVLGSTTKQWSDLFLALGSVVNWDNGDVTLTHAANALTFAGATGGYTFNTGPVIVSQAAAFIQTNVALTDGAGASVGTLTNAPAAGNPTKWVQINDNGTTRRIPAW